MNFNYMNYLPDQEVMIPVFYAFSLLVGLWVLFKFTRKRLVKALTFVFKKFSKIWVLSLLDQRVASKIVAAIPILVYIYSIKLIPDLPEVLVIFTNRIGLSLVLVIALRAVTKLLDNFNAAYSKLEIATDRPIKGFIQVFLILLHLLVIILVISILIDKSPWIFVSGLGAMTAVLLLVFRDTLLSLVAGLQLTSNNYVKVGDWIEMPQFSANGAVIDIALHAVRVENWDKTITTIPTHKFLEHSFLNWRGMEECGGRRIKRSIHIDANSIHFLSNEEARSFKRFSLLESYIDEKMVELENQKVTGVENARRLTNIGTFRAYLVSYLRSNPHIRQDMTFIVRQQEQTPEGVPLEVYVFANDTRWDVYERIQSDIFDHILAITPEFGLKVYQKPAGRDLIGLKNEAVST